MNSFVRALSLMTILAVGCTDQPPARHMTQTTKPLPNLRAVHAVSWETSVPSEDSRQLNIDYFGGSPDCYSYSHSEVEYEEERILVTLFEGRHVRLRKGQTCTLEGVRKTQVVPLESPLDGRSVVDGAAPS